MHEQSPTTAHDEQAHTPVQQPRRGWPVRATAGGALMGLANLVPGISGGTMLLAAGIYPQFVGSVADLSTFRFRRQSILLIGIVIVAATFAIALFAGLIAGLVVEHRWVMYSIFIGLTLGGAPLLWEMIRPSTILSWSMMLLGIAIMALMLLIEPGTAGRTGDGHPYAMYFVAGVCGALAMVLPGISGGYILLILGQYVTILAAVDQFKGAASRGDFAAATDPMHVLVPVGIGVIIGVVGVSNLIRFLLERYQKPTLGLLLGLLLGAVIGIWPFQEGRAPEIGSTFAGQVVEITEDETLILAETGQVLEPADFPTEFFRPTASQVLASLGLIALGFGTSWGIAHLGRKRSAR